MTVWSGVNGVDGEHYESDNAEASHDNVRFHDDFSSIVPPLTACCGLMKWIIPIIITSSYCIDAYCH